MSLPETKSNDFLSLPSFSSSLFVNILIVPFTPDDQGQLREARVDEGDPLLEAGKLVSGGGVAAGEMWMGWDGKNRTHGSYIWGR